MERVQRDVTAQPQIAAAAGQVVWHRLISRAGGGAASSTVRLERPTGEMNPPTS